MSPRRACPGLATCWAAAGRGAVCSRAACYAICYAICVCLTSVTAPAAWALPIGQWVRDQGMLVRAAPKGPRGVGMACNMVWSYTMLCVGGTWVCITASSRAPHPCIAVCTWSDTWGAVVGGKAAARSGCVASGNVTVRVRLHAEHSCCCCSDTGAQGTYQLVACCSTTWCQVSFMVCQWCVSSSAAASLIHVVTPVTAVPAVRVTSAGLFRPAHGPDGLVLRSQL